MTASVNTLNNFGFETFTNICVRQFLNLFSQMYKVGLYIQHPSFYRNAENHELRQNPSSVCCLAIF